MNYRFIVSFLIFSSLIPLTLSATELKLTGGQIFNGTIVNENETRIILLVDGNELSFYKNVIASIDGKPYMVVPQTVNVTPNLVDSSSKPSPTSTVPQKPSIASIPETSSPEPQPQDSPIQNILLCKQPIDSATSEFSEDKFRYYKEIPEFNPPSGYAQIVLIRERFYEGDRKIIQVYCNKTLITCMPEASVTSFVLPPGSHRLLTLRNEDPEESSVLDIVLSPNSITYLKYYQEQRGLSTSYYLVQTDKNSIDQLLACSETTKKLPYCYYEVNWNNEEIEEWGDLENDNYNEAVKESGAVKKTIPENHPPKKYVIRNYTPVNSEKLTRIPIPPLTTGRKDRAYGCVMVIFGALSISSGVFSALLPTSDGTGFLVAGGGGFVLVLGIIKVGIGGSRARAYREWMEKSNRCGKN